MADVTINSLSPLTPSSGLILPVSDGSSTGKVTIGNINSLAPVQTVFGRAGNVTLQSSDVIGALGYTPYNGATNPNGYITDTNFSVPRAVVNFDGQNGVTTSGEFRCNIRSQVNVSKVVRVGTGRYNIFFTTALANTNYFLIGLSGYDNSTTSGSWVNPSIKTMQTTYAQILCVGTDSVSYNTVYNCLAFYNL